MASDLEGVFAARLSAASLERQPDAIEGMEHGIVFVAWPRPPRVGSFVRIDLAIGEDPPVSLQALVIWSRPARAGVVAGFRAQLEDAPPELLEQLRMLAEVVRSRLVAQDLGRSARPAAVEPLDRPVEERARRGAHPGHEPTPGPRIPSAPIAPPPRAAPPPPPAAPPSPTSVPPSRFDRADAIELSAEYDAMELELETFGIDRQTDRNARTASASRRPEPEPAPEQSLDLGLDFANESDEAPPPEPDRGFDLGLEDALATATPPPAPPRTHHVSYGLSNAPPPRPRATPPAPPPPPPAPPKAALTPRQPTSPRLPVTPPPDGMDEIDLAFGAMAPDGIPTPASSPVVPAPPAGVAYTMTGVPPPRPRSGGAPPAPVSPVENRSSFSVSVPPPPRAAVSAEPVRITFASPKTFLVHHERFLKWGEVYATTLPAPAVGQRLELVIEVPDGDPPMRAEAIVDRHVAPPNVPREGWVARLVDDGAELVERFNTAAFMAQFG